MTTPLLQAAPPERAARLLPGPAARARRPLLVGVGSTVAVVAAAAVAVTASPGWPRVRDSFLDPVAAAQAAPDILAGLGLNLLVLVCSTPFILLLGLGLALARSLRGPVWFPVRVAAIAYVDLLRGMPLLVTLYLIGFGLPGLQLQGVPTDPVVLGGLALTLTYAAYVGEVFRAGIESVDREQIEAAYVSGATHWQTMWHIVLPQAVRAVQPALLNDFVALQKDCGMISILGAVDAVRAAQIEVAQTYTFSPYLVAGLMFVLLAVPSGRIADWVNRRVATR